jgi:uncharacterized protein (TIGR00255 family)
MTASLRPRESAKPTLDARTGFSMTLRSMTGFARADGSARGYRWTWEVRSVNGKGLDIRTRLPAGFERLDPQVRERCARRLARGNVQSTLTMVGDDTAAHVKVNREILAEVVAAMRDIAETIETQPPTLDGILSVRGVLESADREIDDEMRSELDAGILASLDQALSDLIGMRAQEGEAIGSVLNLRLGEIEKLVYAAEISPARTPQAIRNRLAEQVTALLDAAPTLDSDRLYQEAVLLATKADVREEIDRLNAHVSAAKELLASGAPAGRRLDFLAQEFAREANTLCAKSNDRSVTAIGLELKAVVDQLREQIQNLE